MLSETFHVLIRSIFGGLALSGVARSPIASAPSTSSSRSFTCHHLHYVTASPQWPAPLCLPGRLASCASPGLVSSGLMREAALRRPPLTSLAERDPIDGC